jgi:hypothetical protein
MHDLPLPSLLIAEARIMSAPLATFIRSNGRHGCPNLFEDPRMLARKVIVCCDENDVVLSFVDLPQKRLILETQKLGPATAIRGTAALPEHRA